MICLVAEANDTDAPVPAAKRKESVLVVALNWLVPAVSATSLKMNCAEPVSVLVIVTSPVPATPSVPATLMPVPARFLVTPMLVIVKEPEVVTSPFALVPVLVTAMPVLGATLTLVTVPVNWSADEMVILRLVESNATVLVPVAATESESVLVVAENCVAPAELVMFLKIFCAEPRSTLVMLTLPVALVLVLKPVFVVIAKTPVLLIEGLPAVPSALVIAIPVEGVKDLPTKVLAAVRTAKPFTAGSLTVPKLIRACVAVVAPVPPSET